MAALDMHEQEQVDALKAWWKDNGRQVMLGAVLAIAVGAGFFGWKYWQGQQKAQAAALFEDFVQKLSGDDTKRMDDAAALLADKHGSTIYAVRAKLMAAQMNIGAKHPDVAIAQLQWVMEHASNDLKDAARLKLAGMRLDEQKYDDALKLLNEAHPETYDAMYLDLKGDVYNAQGKKDEARAAYKQALDKSQTRQQGAGFNFALALRMKLDGLGGEAHEAKPAEAKTGAAK